MLNRYLWREVSPLYLVGFLVFMILLTTDLISSVAGVVLRNHTPFHLAFLLYWTKIPEMLERALPLAVPFAVLIGLGRLARDSELKAVWASGVRPSSLLWPLLGLGLLVSAVTFLNDNLWLPSANASWEKVAYRVWYNSPPPHDRVLYTSVVGGNLYYAGSVQQTGPDTASLEGVLVRTPTAVYTASSGVWNSLARSWRLFGVWVDRTGQKPVFQPQLTVPQGAPFAPYTPQLSQQSLGQLMRAELQPGLSAHRRQALRFELQRRLADPLAALALAVAAGCLGLLLRNRSWSFIGVIVMIFLYYVAWTYAPQFAQSGALPSWLAAWSPNLLMVAFGLLLAGQLR